MAEQVSTMQAEACQNYESTTFVSYNMIRVLVVVVGCLFFLLTDYVCSIVTVIVIISTLSFRNDNVNDCTNNVATETSETHYPHRLSSL